MDNKLKKIIMADDDMTNLNIAKNALIDRYDVFTVPSAKKLFQILEKVTPDLILLDIEMPEMNGYEAIEKLKSSESTSDIPVIFLTGNIDPESELKGLSMGAIDYIAKPFSFPLLSKRVEVHLLVEDQKKELKNYNSNLEIMVEEKTKEVSELQSTLLQTVAELVEYRDNITGGHIERTQEYLRVLVNALQKHGLYSEEISTWDIDLFIMSSQLHDVGKIGIKDHILMKPDRLTKDEMEIMKTHAVLGVEIIRKIEAKTKGNEFLKYAEILAGTHHEKWDGSGYPLGLKGNEIPLQGRLMALVDVYDALTQIRPYKGAASHEEAVDIIKKDMGFQFDPKLDEIFSIHEKEFKNIANENQT